MGPTRLQQALTSAVACAMIIIATNLVFYATDTIYTFGGQLARLGQGVVFLVAFIVLLVMWRKKEPAVTYMQAFVFGLLFLAFYIPILFIYEYCFFAYIEPDFYQNLEDRTLQMLVDFKVPDAQIEDTRKQFEEGRKNSAPFDLALWYAIGRVISDVVVLAITAIFLRKKPALQ